MPANVTQAEPQNNPKSLEGVMVVGEAVRAVQPDVAEFVIEISTTGGNAAQALRDNHLKATQVAQAIAASGVQAGDLQTISFNLYNLYSQAMPALPAFNAVPQIPQPGFGAQPEVQFGSYQARKMVRVNVREPVRVGEIADIATRAGAAVIGTFTFRASDEAAARRSALEAAGKDARSKAETLAAAAGRQLGEPLAISEDILASNGTYAALRSAIPFAFGPGTPQVTGDLEYYARVSARYRFQ